MSPQQVAARRAVEALRAGVPSRAAVQRLGTTQERVREQFDEALGAVREGRPVEPLVLAANFGDGKSHLLQYLQATAAQQGFVTAGLVVSPEMPLGNPHVVLKALAEAAEAPGRTGKALRAMTPDLPDGAESLARLRDWAETAGIEERFVALLHLYQEFRVDEELRQQILDDFEGKPLRVGVIRQKLRELGQAAAYDLKAPRQALLAHSRIRLLAQFCRAVTGTGLVVLFDELERLRRFTRRQRFAAYQEVGWWGELAHEAGSGVLPVLTMTRGFVEETIQGGLLDEQRLHLEAERLEPGPRKLVEQGLKLLTSRPLALRPPTAEQLADIRYRVRELYAEAYATSPRDPGAEATDQRTMRSRIRSWITRWDLERYRPEEATEVEAAETIFDQRDVPDDVLPSDGDGDSVEG